MTRRIHMLEVGEGEHRKAFEIDSIYMVRIALTTLIDALIGLNDPKVDEALESAGFLVFEVPPGPHIGGTECPQVFPSVPDGEEATS